MNYVINKLRNDQVGVIPTDTLYGLVGHALSKKAVARIYKLKKRSPKKASIVLISSLKDLKLFGVKINKATKKIIQKYWPGKVSIILPCIGQKFVYLSRGTKSLAFRIPNKKDLLNLLKKTGPLIAPSANPENKKPAETITEAKKYFRNSVDFYINGGKLKSLPSTLIKIESNKLRVLRKGAVKITQIMTLCIVHEKNKILLGFKKRGFGNNRWNGFGGKVYLNETIEEATLRELKEECGIDGTEFQKMGIINFNIRKTGELITVYVYKIVNYLGVPKETSEMKPEWFAIKNIPYTKMWPDDKFWLPYFLQNKKFKGEFEFADYNKIISHKIKRVKNIN